MTDELRRHVRDAIADGVDPARLPGLEATVDRVLDAMLALGGFELGEPFTRSPARRGLDLLLATHPHLELVDAEWQRPTEADARAAAAAGVVAVGGPWLRVTLGQRSAGDVEAFALYPYAIWKATGGVYGMDGPAGPVHDDPFLEPAP